MRAYQQQVWAPGVDGINGRRVNSPRLAVFLERSFKRMFGHKVVLLNQRSCELTRRGPIKGAWFRCSGIRCVPDVRVLAPPKAFHTFVSFLLRSRG